MKKIETVQREEDQAQPYIIFLYNYYIYIYINNSDKNFRESDIES